MLNCVVPFFIEENMSKNGFSDHLSVIDTETLGIGSSSCILSIGVTLSTYENKDITFKELMDSGMYLKFDIAEQRKHKRTVNDETCKWWFTQPEEARKVLKKSDQDVSIYSLYDKLTEFYSDRGVDIKNVDLYERSSGFDLGKLQDLFIEDQKYPEVPWNRHNTYEISTALRFLGFNRYGNMRVSDFSDAQYHNAMSDATVDHIRILKCLHSSIQAD
jgi:hypothetical protein